MDEPTAALSATEAGRLLAVARRLRDQGAAPAARPICA
jgi:ABC-type sugar transport system ATPase subunit